MLVAQDKVITTDSLNSEVARIYFHRTSSMLGAAGWHFVIDKGENIIYNAIVFQKKSFNDEQFDFGKGHNVKQLYLKFNNNEARLLAGRPRSDDERVKSKSDCRDYNSIENLSKVISKYLMVFKDVYGSFYMTSENLNPNAWIAGIVDNGQTIMWERPPGKMKLEVITEGGDQIFAKSFQVESGKSYLVEYSYGKQRFLINEKR